jgi:hypothetical protein
VVAGVVGDWFEDYLMFIPPADGNNGVCPVPVLYSSWSTDGDASITPPMTWADFTGSAGTNQCTQFDPYYDFPSWSQNCGNGYGQWVAD